MKDSKQDLQQDDDWISKTEMKRQADEIQALGIQLTNLGKQQLDDLPLEERLKDAIELAQRIRGKREGYRRQLQYIGKIMRTMEIDDIKATLKGYEAKHQQANLFFHQLEQTRDQMIAEGDSAIQAFIDDYPHADRQQIRQLVRSAQREQKNNKPPKAARELYKYLRELTEEA